MKSAPGPSVSVIVPCYNAASTIERAINSIRNQTLVPTEIIAVDDGSTDDTVAVLHRIGGDLVRTIPNTDRSGAAAARNRGAAAAKGTYLAFLDADDEWLPAKLSKQVALIEKQPGVSFVSCRSHFVDASGKWIPDLYAGIVPEAGPDAWKHLLVANYVATPSVLLRRSTFEAIGGFDETLSIAEDQDLWIRLAMAGPVGFIDEPLLIVHAEPHSLSQRFERRRAEFEMKMIDYHLSQAHSRLSLCERRRVAGTRCSRIGRAVYKYDKRNGFRLLLRAILNGSDVPQNALYLLTETEPGHKLKRIVRGLWSSVT